MSGSCFTSIMVTIPQCATWRRFITQSPLFIIMLIIQRKEMPGLCGFGARNIKYMRSFYEEWNEYFNSAAMASELDSSKNNDEIGISSLPILYWQPPAAELQAAEFVGISFTHHIEILTKAKTFEERVFYIHQAFLNKWDKYKLRGIQDCRGCTQGTPHRRRIAQNNG